MMSTMRGLTDKWSVITCVRAVAGIGQVLGPRGFEEQGGIRPPALGLPSSYDKLGVGAGRFRTAWDKARHL